MKTVIVKLGRASKKSNEQRVINELKRFSPLDYCPVGDHWIGKLEDEQEERFVRDMRHMDIEVEVKGD